MNQRSLQPDFEERNSTEILFVAGWRVSSDSLRIVRGDESVRLEPKVMQVLIFLASRAGEVISRKELEDTIWEGRIVGYDALSNIIIKLRKAFQDNSHNPHVIETISKTGYCLIADVEWRKPQKTSQASLKNKSNQIPVSQHFVILSRKNLLILVLLLLLSIVLAWVFHKEQSITQQKAAIHSALSFKKPSIAVLPFKNIGNDPDQEYFSDGVSEDLITDLSKVSGLRVVASNSTFVYKENQENEKKIGKELGVFYLLKGSIQKHLKRVRLNVRLVDTRNGSSIWAERYDRQLTDLFHIQDELATKIVAALEVKLAPEDKKRLTRNYIVSIEAYDAFLRGLDHYGRRSFMENQLAKQQFNKAIKMDPGFARAYAALALSYSWDVINGWDINIKDSLVKASELAEKAIQKDESIPQVYFVKGYLELTSRNYESAALQAEKAIDIEPSYADGYALLAWILHYAGKPQEGLKVMENAVKLNPRIPSVYLLIQGALNYSMHQTDRALNDFERAIQINPLFMQPRVWLAASYVAAGHLDKAQWEAEEIMLLNPRVSIKNISQAYPIQDSDYLQRFQSDLKQAGLPE